MTEDIKIFEPELRAAYQQTFNALGIRLSPTASIQELHNTLRDKYGVEVTRDGNMLSGTQNGAPINLATSLRALSTKPELGEHFVGGLDGISSLDDFKGDTKAKSEWVAKHGGPAYEKLVADSMKPKRAADVSLDPDKANRDDAKCWTWPEKNAFITQYGPEGYARVLARKPYRAKQ